MDEMCDRSEDVDKEFEEEVNRVKQYYTDLEDKLKIWERS